MAGHRRAVATPSFGRLSPAMPVERVPATTCDVLQALMAKPGFISAKPLSVLLGDVFSDAYAKQGFAARELVTRWAEIAGREIAAHSEPLKLQWPRPVA